MSEMDDIIDGMAKLGFLGGKLPANAQPLPPEGGPTLTMFRPTTFARIEDPKDREHFKRILEKMKDLGLLFDDDDGKKFGPPNGTGSFTIDGCVDDSDK